jgi:hypothetical protein
MLSSQENASCASWKATGYVGWALYRPLGQQTPDCKMQTPRQNSLAKDLHLGLHQWERFRCPCWTRFDHPDHL